MAVPESAQERLRDKISRLGRVLRSRFLGLQTPRLCIKLHAGTSKLRGIGTGSSVLYHSPLNALISHLLSSGYGTLAEARTKPEVRGIQSLTIKDNIVCIMEVDAMV